MGKVQKGAKLEKKDSENTGNEFRFCGRRGGSRRIDEKYMTWLNLPKD